MKTFKLVVSDRIEFDVKFTLNDGGTEKPFGLRLAARRQPLEDQQREFSAGVKVAEYLEARGCVVLSWIGSSPLVDEEGNPVPASKEALDVLYAQVGGMVELVWASYLQANGAKGKSGN